MDSVTVTWVYNVYTTEYFTPTKAARIVVVGNQPELFELPQPFPGLQ